MYERKRVEDGGNIEHPATGPANKAQRRGRGTRGSCQHRRGGTMNGRGLCGAGRAYSLACAVAVAVAHKRSAQCPRQSPAARPGQLPCRCWEARGMGLQHTRAGRPAGGSTTLVIVQRPGGGGRGHAKVAGTGPTSPTPLHMHALLACTHAWHAWHAWQAQAPRT